MNAKISVFVICIEAIIYLLLYNLHDCTFKRQRKILDAREMDAFLGSCDKALDKYEPITTSYFS